MPGWRKKLRYLHGPRPIRIGSTDLLYFPVPKVACTSIKHALLNHNRDGLADRLPVRLPVRGEIRQVHGYYGSHLYHWWYPLQFASERWVCVVRDPLERFMSAYANRVLQHRDLQKKECAQQLERIGRRLKPDLDEFIDGFADYFRHSPHIRHHFRPMCDYLGRDPGRFSHVFALSELDRFEALCREAGVELHWPHLHTSGARLPVGELLPAHRARLESFYADDYACWGSYSGS